MEKVTIGRADLWCGDCQELLAKLEADAVISDPPYGMNWCVNKPRSSAKWDKVHGDDKPFDPSPWLSYPRVVLFGGNHFAQRLPVGTTLVWIKKYKFAGGVPKRRRACMDERRPWRLLPL